MTSNGLLISDSIKELATFSYICSFRPDPEHSLAMQPNSFTFECPNVKAISWRTSCYPSTIKKRFYLTVTLLSSDRPFVNCEFDLSFSFGSSIEQSPQKSKVVYTQLNQKFKFTFSQSSTDADFIHVYLLMKVSGPVNTNSANITPIKPPPICLTEDLRSLLDKRDMGDLTLIVGEKKIKVHEAIVRARSPKLEAMVDSSPICCELTISDTDSDVVELVVRYLYTDEVEDIDGSAERLYPVACNLALLGLKTMCERALMSSLTVDNAAKLLVLADGKPGGFKTQVVNFMKNHGAEVAATTGFKFMAISHSQLFLEVYCAIYDVPFDSQAAA